MIQRCLANPRCGNWHRLSWLIHQHMPRPHQFGKSWAVLFAGEHHIGRIAQVIARKRRPLSGIIFQLIRHQMNFTIGVNLTQPVSAQLPGNFLRSMMAQHDHHLVHLCPGRVNQMPVPQVRRIEFPNRETGDHAATPGRTISSRHVRRQANKPMNAIQTNTAYSTAVKYKCR